MQKNTDEGTVYMLVRIYDLVLKQVRKGPLRYPHLSFTALPLCLVIIKKGHEVYLLVCYPSQTLS